MESGRGKEEGAAWKTGQCSVHYYYQYVFGRGITDSNLVANSDEKRTVFCYNIGS
jgi:hypothetical protein